MMRMPCAAVAAILILAPSLAAAQGTFSPGAPAKPWGSPNPGSLGHPKTPDYGVHPPPTYGAPHTPKAYDPPDIGQPKPFKPYEGPKPFKPYEPWKPTPSTSVFGPDHKPKR